MPEYTPAWDYLIKAVSSRREALEGQSRVLCRLAAASAIKNYLADRNRQIPAGNAYEALLEFSQTASLPSDIKEALNHLSMRVDQDYNLPDGIDLISDVEKLIIFFEAENNHQENHAFRK
ncbi:MAG: hypothetical protein AB9891_17415 [Anaerolineaceae bacterium]